MSQPPNEPPTGGAPDDGAGGSPDDPDTPFRGWIDPDDRLWRHPSEAAGGPRPARPPLPPVLEKPHRGPLMVIVGAASVVAAVAWGIILLSPPSDHPASDLSRDAGADAPMTTLAASQRVVPPVAETAGNSMVELQADTTHGTVLLAAVAVAEGGLVATTADGLRGLQSIDMVGPDGHLLRASVVATDQTSDLALIAVPDDVPVATFADDGTLAPGAADYTLTMAGPAGAVPTLRCEPGSVTAVGQPISLGPADGLAAIVSSAPGAVQEPGDPLLNAAGEVIGILYDDPASPAAAPATFLPSALILGVADDLRSSSRVAHGWLVGVALNPSASPGAQIMSVTPGSPAAAGKLQPGEVITGVDAAPVRTAAELRERLYVLAPHASVALSVRQGDTTRVVDVSLSPSP